MMKTTSVLMLLAAVLLVSPFPLAGQPTEIKPLAIGAAAPDFNLPGIDGRNYTLSDFEDYEVLFVVFWANHCPTV
jgi:hypothetical protein